MRLLYTVLMILLVVAILVLNDAEGKKRKGKHKRTLHKIHLEKKTTLKEIEKTKSKEGNATITDEKIEKHAKKGDYTKSKVHYTKKRGKYIKLIEKLGQKAGIVTNKTTKFPKHCNTSADCGENACCIQRGAKQVCREAPNKPGKHCSVTCPCVADLTCSLKQKGRGMRGKCITTLERPDALQNALNKLHKIAKSLKKNKGRRKEKKERKGKKKEIKNKRRKGEKRRVQSNSTD